MQLLIGILASMLHVVSGPDHLAAVTPIAIESKNKAWSIGLFWGIGHTVGVLIIGILFIMFREIIPVEAISKYSEQIIGIVLILIGIWAFISLAKNHNHLSEVKKSSSNKKVLAALSVGIIHGLAGVSHLIGLLPALAFPSRFDAVMYLSGFGFGTIAAMILYSVILGFLALKSSDRRKVIMYNGLRAVGGALALVVGVFWIVKTI